MYLVLYENGADRVERDNHVLIVDWPHATPPMVYYTMSGDYAFVSTDSTTQVSNYQRRASQAPAPGVRENVGVVAARVERQVRASLRTGDFDTETGISPADLSDGLVSSLRQAIASAYQIPPGILFGDAPVGTNPCAEIEVAQGLYIIDDPDGEP